MARNVKQFTNETLAKKGVVIKKEGKLYIEYTLPSAIIKFGYNCEPKGIDYKIYLNDSSYEIGKTQIFEMEDVEITKIALPQDIQFVFDYVI